MAEYDLLFATRQLLIVNKRNIRSLDIYQRRGDNLTQEQKTFNRWFHSANKSAAETFHPLKFTDSRGARWFNLLPIYSMQMRSVQLSPQALSRIIRMNGINTGGHHRYKSIVLATI